MLAETLPACLCGEHNYEGGGGYVGPGLAYTGFSCKNCNRRFMELHPWLFVNRDANPVDERSIERYVNAVILPFRRELEEKDKLSRMTPQIPENLVVYHRSGDTWEELDRVASASIPLPVDPIAVKHREFWADIVKDVGAREIPNEYYSDHSNNEPWYEYKVIDAIIKFGPRKRVLTIKVERDKPFEVKNIAAAAKEDGTSYWADGSWHQWDAVSAKTIEVHAWGKEKFDQYLAHIMFGLGKTQGGENRERPRV